MRWPPCACSREIHVGADRARGVIIRARWPEAAGRAAQTYAGQIQTVYLDPPFDTGKPYFLRLPVGETGWRKGKPMVELPAYDDRWTDGGYEEMIRAAIQTAHAMLKPEGALFLHIDPRRGPLARRLLDEVFGAGNYVNEIVWAYETGGRATGHFSRKHDTLLFYRRSDRLYFDIAAAAMPRARRHNHMRRGVDEQGRAYSAINSGGKEYRYYDDEPVYASDVWTDIAPLQQRDPRRTGFDTQKPSALLARVIGCASRPGDWAADLFAGSGTTARTAADMDRNFVSMDASDASVVTTRKRMLGCSFELDAPSRVPDGTECPALDAAIHVEGGVLNAALAGYDIGKAGVCPPDGLAHVDQWSFGIIRGGVFHAYANAARDRRSPALPDTLSFGEGPPGGEPAIAVVDILGRRIVFRGPSIGGRL
ncbi:MAG: site-specific DNA-methyltransferase [Oscillospiraceae bacterium]|jgi:DNA modification methylase|nr:site-specific DNA-methyltransferase [Oscillospiraceae bacterium]